MKWQPALSYPAFHTILSCSGFLRFASYCSVLVYKSALFKLFVDGKWGTFSRSAGYDAKTWKMWGRLEGPVHFCSHVFQRISGVFFSSLLNSPRLYKLAIERFSKFTWKQKKVWNTKGRNAHLVNLNGNRYPEPRDISQISKPISY